MKKLIIFSVLTFALISCGSNCDKKCSGFDKNLTEYKFSPILTPQKEIVFKNEKSGEEFKMSLKSFASTEPYVESSCGGYAESSSCKTTFQAVYDYSYKNVSSVFFTNLYLIYRSNFIPSHYISFKKMTYDAVISYKDDKFTAKSYKVHKPLQKYVAELNGDMLSIANESDDYDLKTIKKIWIKKNKGIVKINLDDQIWVKQ